ncbi:DNA polymerase [Ruegeria sp. 6PALISEP08]|uniref:DNA polymerase n=1 Tax=Ruegeria sp. 6PALISEP08 TaxID=1225660 RepID=UPI000AC881B5|nr:DNA polymerase [Ruegeria sp. 6PALISEP08]
MIDGFNRFREIWLLDFEFRSPSGHCPRVVCMVARELRTNRILRMWEFELRGLATAPFSVGDDALIVCYFAPAEMGCFVDLGWPPPRHILDLYVEYKALMNGRKPSPNGYGLPSALMSLGIPTIGAEYKDAMRGIIIERETHVWDEAERRAILAYCQSDVDALRPLFFRLAPFITRGGDITLAQALFRGRYMVAVARMEWEGVPIDTTLVERLKDCWKDIRLGLIRQMDRFGFYRADGTFSFANFDAFIERHGLSWPRTETGRAKMDDDTLKGMLAAYPQLAEFRELRSTLDKLTLNKLAVGPDGRNRTMISPFGTVTSRNAPSTTKFVFGPAKWIRHLIVPPERQAIAYLDWRSQEIAIAAGLSGDPQMRAAYATDPYLSFAISIGLAPQGATRQTHGTVRDAMKPVILGVNYGLGAQSLAHQTGKSVKEAMRLLDAHRDTYPVFWAWLEGIIEMGSCGQVIETRLGWPVQPRCEKFRNHRMLQNFPMQANGADCLRVAACEVTEAGHRICAPVHDALVLIGDAETIHEEARQVAAIMTRAATTIARIEVPVDCAITMPGERYNEPRGRAMFDTVLDQIDGKV